MSWTLLLFSALGVIAVTAIARAMGFAGRPLLDERRARDEAERIPGFRAGAARIAADGRSALVDGVDGRRAVVLPLGDRFVARRLEAGMVVAEDGAGLVVDFGEPMLGRRSLDWGEAREGAA